MKKRLLLAFAAIATFMNMSAYNVDDYVYTNSARFKIVGDNLVTNGNFADSFNGWTPINAEFPAAQTFNVNFGTGPNGSNTIQVLEGQTSLDAGIYQSVAIPAAGTYVVTMQVMNVGTAGFTDIDLSGGNTNYINAYFQTDETPVLATVWEEKVGSATYVHLEYGTDGLSAGYPFAYSGEQFTDVAFSFDAPADGKLIIDLRGLAQGLEIANIEVHAAQQALDRRVAEARVAWVNTILNGFEWTEDYEYWEDVVADVATLNTAIASGSDDEVAQNLENLEVDVMTFLGTNCTNVLDYVATKDGSAATGNNSANWDNWNGKWNKLQTDYKNQAPWSWSTDRWAHKTNAVNSPMQIQWMRGSSGTWDNIATLTTDLDKGVYFWGAAGDGGMMTLNKNRWARSLAVECAETQFFFNGDTTDVVLLNPVVRKEMLYKYEVKENVEKATLGIRCNLGQGRDITDGFDAGFYSPVLYKINVKGELTVEEKAYLDAVKVQLDAFKGRIDVAKGYMENEKTPWGKDQLQIGITEAEKRYADFSAMTQDEILETFYDMSASYTGANPDSTYVYNTASACPDLVMNAGVRYINNEYINKFTELNSPLTDLIKVIGDANQVLNDPLNDYGDKETFVAVISSAQALYDTQFASPYSEEGAKALVDKKAELLEAIEAFKKSAELDPFLAFDFENGYKMLDEAGAPTDNSENAVTVVIDGTKGSIVLPAEQFDMQTSTTYGWPSKNEIFKSKQDKVNEGNLFALWRTPADIDLTQCGITESDVVRIRFTLFQPVMGGNTAELALYDAENARIAGYKIGTWDALSYNDLGLTTLVPSRSSRSYFSKLELKDCYDLMAAARVDHDWLIDFKAKTIKATTIQYYGDKTTDGVYATNIGQEVELVNSKNLPAAFRMSYDNANTGRRSSIDNIVFTKFESKADGIKDVEAIKLNNIKAVKAIENGQFVIKSAKGTFNAAGVQMK